MKYLLDTCVISELIKPQPNEKVIEWVRSKEENQLYLSVLTLGEIEKGIAKIHDKNRERRLRRWLEDDLKNRFDGRILLIDLKVSAQWGRQQGRAELSGKPIPRCRWFDRGLRFGQSLYCRNEKMRQICCKARLRPTTLGNDGNLGVRGRRVSMDSRSKLHF